MFKKTKKQLKDVLKYGHKLIKAKNHNPQSIEIKNIVPKKIGVYLWRSKRSKKIVYIGRAFGKNGLYQRIVKQHLSNSYTKSVFRKQIAEEKGLSLKDESASFIRRNFVFSFISFERSDINIAALLEILLINEYSPKYNRAGKF